MRLCLTVNINVFQLFYLPKLCLNYDPQLQQVVSKDVLVPLGHCLDSVTQCLGLQCFT